MGNIINYGLVDLAYLAILFNENDFVKNYIKLIKTGKIKIPSLVKCTTEDLNMPYYDDHIIILIKDTNSDKNIERLLSIFRQHSCFVIIKPMFIDKKSYFSVVFNYPFGFTRDCRYIKDGFYSRIDPSTKTLILDYWGLKRSSNLYNVLYRIKGAVSRNGFKMAQNEQGEYYNKLNDPIPLDS